MLRKYNMAFIYRYHIKNYETRKKIDLKSLEDEIINTVQNNFKSNLKDCRVESKYYEYKLHYSIDNASIRAFGRKLYQSSTSLQKIKKKYQLHHGLFKRMNQCFYAFAEEANSSKGNIVILIDELDFNDTVRLQNQSERYFNKYINSKDVNIERGISKYSDTDLIAIKKKFYLDVFYILVNETTYKEIIKNSCSYITAAHTKSKKSYSERNKNAERILLESERDVSALINQESLHETIQTGYKELDILKLKNIVAAAEKMQEINESFSFNISAVTEVKSFSQERNRSLCFKVYNVGQGLATSIEERGELPFLYFDFGMSCLQNTFNRPQNINININVDNYPSIILSHIHIDHWYAITEFTEAFKCQWYIPNQDLKTFFRKRCAEIIASGGNVYYITDTIRGSVGTIFINGDSKHTPSRSPKHIHENGLSMRLRLTLQNTTINVLISGDQYYDYIPDSYLRDLNVLVACHHGGEYSWSSRRNVYEDIPQPIVGPSKIIYSYGETNTYQHPSKTDDYRRRGWESAHNTPDDSDYIL